MTLVTPTFAPEQLGTPLYATDLARWFRDRGWRVQVVTAQPFYPQFKRYDGYGRHRRHDSFEGMPVLRLPTIVPAANSTSRRAITDLNFMTQGLLAATRGTLAPSRHVVSISAGSPLAVVVGSAIARRARAHHTAIVHDVMSGLAKGLGLVSGASATAMTRELEKRSLNTAANIFALTPQMAETLRSLGVWRPVHVLPLWATITRPERPITRSADLQYSGNFGRKQGLDQLVALAREIQRLRPGTSTLVRGAGSLERQLVEASHNSDLNLSIESPVDHSELATALAASPIHIVTQDPGAANHVMPSKVINALAAGCAVVAMTTANSPIEDIGRKCGALSAVISTDVRDVAKIVFDLLTNSDHDSLAIEATSYVERDHDRDRLLLRLEDELMRFCAP